jgi:hypothetical protein
VEPQRYAIDLQPFRFAFDAFVSGSSRPPGPLDPEALRWYFATRKAVEDNDVRALLVTLIDRFHGARRRFAGAAFESLYAEWRAHGDDVLARLERPSGQALAAAGRWLTRELPFTYTQFGTLPGVA